MGNIHVIVGGQFGSESKGHVAAALVQDGKLTNPMLIRVAGPNAGHTAYDLQGREWALRQIPVAAVVDHLAPIVLGAGSEIDPEVLEDEIVSLEMAGIPIANRLWVDSQATVIEDYHKGREANIETGTTGKGIGAARASRIMREAATWESYGGMFGHKGGRTSDLIEHHLNQGGDVMVEGTQGYGLGVHTGFYPHTTSSDCRAIDFLAMAGINPWAHPQSKVIPWVVIRTHAIRIAGNSGPLGGETTWDALEIEPEYTTVTKKIRRVGGFNGPVVREAIRANGGPDVCKVALGFFDYISEDDQGEMGVGVETLSQRGQDLLAVYTAEVFGSHRGELAYLGTGPYTRVWL